MGTTTEVTADVMIARLQAAAAEVAEAKEAREVALERRNELIAQAVNELKMTTTTVAKHAGVSQSRVMGVLGEG